VSQPTTADEPSGKLGTFGGVFAPSLLTILGLVLFLRLGFVTGNVGLVKMLVILGLSVAVSVVTTISLAAIATNLKVGGGGVYFIISRTLGPAFGGAIGLVLYLAMSISVAFYAIGLGEALTSVVGSSSPSLPRVIAAITIVALLGLAWLGADIATRLQYVVMVCLAVAIVGYFVGVVGDLDFGRASSNLWAPDGGDSFWVSFAIFFPAITGFTQGVAMSGDLKTPSESISRGTFGAIAVSTVVYLLVILTFVLAVSLPELREDTAIMRRLSAAPWLIDVGVIAATLSSAIASIMGAPRTLQRLAADRLVKPLEIFAVGAGPDNNPRRGVLLSAAIALATVGLGDLDLVAPVISMFFLASYGMINFATYSEARAASTSFRPRFRLFDWRLSLAGTIGCLGVIIAIDPIAGAAAGAAVYLLYRYLQKSVQQVRWADSTRGFHSSQVRNHLQLMGPQADAGRDWRPCTVVFAPRDPVRRGHLTSIASWLEGNAGYTTVVRIIAGQGARTRRSAVSIELELQRELATEHPGIYGRVAVAQELGEGVAAVLQSHGIGALRANLALFGWNDTPRDANGNDQFGLMVQSAARLGINVAIVTSPDHAVGAVTTRAQPRICVWWDDDRSGQLLTMLAWMCTRSAEWKKAEIEVWVASTSPDTDANRVAELLDDARLPATVKGSRKPEQLSQTMQRADLVLVPTRIRRGKPLGPGNQPIEALRDGLPTTLFVHAASPIELDIQPDDASSAALAIAHDRSAKLSARADKLSEKASVLLVTAEILRMEAEANPSPTADREAAEATQLATAAHRKYLDAFTRAESARNIEAEIDPTADTTAIDPELWAQLPNRRGNR